MIRRTYWRTRFGFYLAAVGSACGLGNLWRFPYVVGENGGGAFLLLYVFVALIMGLPLLISELMVGKSSRRSVLGATLNLTERTGKAWKWLGRLSVLLSLVVLSYYAVVSGWVLHFFVQFSKALVFGWEAESASGITGALMHNGWLQIALASSHLLVAVVVVLKGVQDGLEKWVSYIVPLFAFLLVFLVIRSLSLPSTPDALRFLFYPDFSQLRASSLLSAIGHACFTLSIGFGTMVTFGSYLRESDHIPTAGFRVTLVDTFISILAGLLVFPIVVQGSFVRASDPSVLFQALPPFLMGQAGGDLFGILFFLCLYVAALGASIGLLEMVVANIVDRTKISRNMATWSAGFAALFLAVGPALSSSVLSEVSLGERGVLEILDTTLINLLLPVVATGMGLCAVLALTDDEKQKHFVDSTRIVSVSLFPHWSIICRVIAPLILLLALILQALDWFNLV